jgi:hypothetical protein
MHIASLLLLLTASAALLPACGSSPSEPGETFDPVGTVTFTFQGARTGTFAATGEMQVAGGGLPQPVTGATAFQGDNLLNVFGYRARTASRGDFFSLQLGEVAVAGTYALDPLACQQQTMARCRIGFFVPDLDPSELQGSFDLAALSERTYVLVLGSVTVTARTPMRVRGTFQGVAFRANEQAIQNMLTVNGGTFDLPIRPQ